MNAYKEILMVKQGTPEEKKMWSIPTGGKEPCETFQECCIREISEETGYHGRIIKSLFVKQGTSSGVAVEVQYFAVEVYGGSAKIQDPDNLIYEIDWKPLDEIKNLELSYPGDLEVLVEYVENGAIA